MGLQSLSHTDCRVALVVAADDAVPYASAACSLAHTHHLGVLMHIKTDLTRHTVGVAA